MAVKERAGGGRADNGSDDQARPMKRQAEACDAKNRSLNQDEERNQGEKSRHNLPDARRDPVLDLFTEFRKRQPDLFSEEVRERLQHIGNRADQRRIADAVKRHRTGSPPRSGRRLHRRGCHSMSLPGEGGSGQNRKRRRRSKPGPDFAEHKSMRSPATPQAIARVPSPTNWRHWGPCRERSRPVAARPPRGYPLRPSPSGRYARGSRPRPRPDDPDSLWPSRRLRRRALLLSP